MLKSLQIGPRLDANNNLAVISSVLRNRVNYSFGYYKYGNVLMQTDRGRQRTNVTVQKRREIPIVVA